MRKLVGLVMLGLLAFYVGWPAWSGYQIAQAFQGDDRDLLARKVDFPSVRQSLRPTVAAEVSNAVERAKRDAGPLGALIAGQIKEDVVTRMAEGTLTTVITPENLIRIARQGGNMREAFEKVMLEQIAKSGGLPGAGGGEAGGGRLQGQLPGGIQIPGGLAGLGKRLQQAGSGGADQPKAAEPQAQAKPTADKPKFGLSNIKSFGFDGPLGFSVGVARDASAAGPDVTAHLGFRDWDWKVVGITPRPLGRQ